MLLEYSVFRRTKNWLGRTATGCCIWSGTPMSFTQITMEILNKLITLPQRKIKTWKSWIETIEKWSMTILEWCHWGCSALRLVFQESKLTCFCVYTKELGQGISSRDVSSAEDDSRWNKWIMSTTSESWKLTTRKLR